MATFQTVNVNFKGTSPDTSGVVTKTETVNLKSSATAVSAAIMGWALEFNSRNGNNHNVRALGAGVNDVILVDRNTVTVKVSLRLTDDNKNFLDPERSSVQVLLIGS